MDLVKNEIRHLQSHINRSYWMKMEHMIQIIFCLTYKNETLATRLCLMDLI